MKPATTLTLLLLSFVASSDFYDDAAELRAEFSAAFGEEIDDAWAAWRSELGG